MKRCRYVDNIFIYDTLYIQPEPRLSTIQPGDFGMNVLSVAVTRGRNPPENLECGPGIDRAAFDERYTRIAFCGRTPKGRSGVAFDFSTMKVTGHKLEPIPEEMVDLVRHFPLEESRRGLQAAVNGEDVLIGSTEEGILLRWNGPTVQIYANGEDSE